VRALVQAAGLPVLDRAADRPGLGRPRDRQRRGLRLGAVAVLEVGRDGQRGRQVERGNVLANLVERDPAVAPAEREREPRARGRQRRKAQRLEHARRAGVPGVRDHERLALVQRAERLRLQPLSLLDGHRRTIRSYASAWMNILYRIRRLLWGSEPDHPLSEQERKKPPETAFEVRGEEERELIGEDFDPDEPRSGRL
jgi:hypothetical protein